jgi:uncharacterized protein (DUF302 family)
MGVVIMTDELEGRGIISLGSRYSVEESVARISAALQARGITVFAVIDQSREAETVGLTLRPTQLIIFGDPKTGTPLMNASPSLAIDLPLKALIWEDAGGKVQVSYNSSKYLQNRHALAQEPFATVGALLSKAIE